MKGQLNSPDDLVVVTSLTDHEGKPAASARNRLVLFVTDVARESAARSVRVRSGSGGRIAVSPDPIHLNVYFMLAGNFDPDNYGEALKVLSHSVQFFQSNPVFNHRNAPEMAEGLEQLSCEIHNLSHEVSSHLWGVHGGRYVPSIHFKMRMIAIDSGVMEREDFVVRASETLAEAGEPG